VLDNLKRSFIPDFPTKLCSHIKDFLSRGKNLKMLSPFTESLPAFFSFAGAAAAPLLARVGIGFSPGQGTARSPYLI
jgi:hypothetical protein